MNKNKILDYPLLVFIAVIYLIMYIVQYTDGVFEKDLGFPQLMLPASIFIGMYFGDKLGAVYGFFIGAAVDAVSANVICYNTIFMLLAGYFSGVLVQFIINNNFRSSIIVSIFFSLIYYFGMWIINGFDKLTLSLNLIPSFFSTVFFSLILYLLLGLLIKFRKKQLSNRN